jgi:hypothetical protein
MYSLGKMDSPKEELHLSFTINANSTRKDELLLSNSESSGNSSSWNGNYSYGDWEEDYVGSFHFSLSFQVIVYILYNAVFVSAVFGNILVVYVIGSSARMRTVTNYLIGNKLMTFEHFKSILALFLFHVGNLALGDLLMALLCVPFSYIPVLSQYWPFGGFLCAIVSPAQATTVFVSAYTLVALAVDRYMAILYPLRPRLRQSQALLVIAVIWVVALITAIPVAVFTRVELDELRGVPLCEEVGKLKFYFGFLFFGANTSVCYYLLESQ